MGILALIFGLHWFLKNVTISDSIGNDIIKNNPKATAIGVKSYLIVANEDFFFYLVISFTGHIAQ